MWPGAELAHFSAQAYSRGRWLKGPSFPLTQGRNQPYLGQSWQVLLCFLHKGSLSSPKNLVQCIIIFYCQMLFKWLNEIFLAVTSLRPLLHVLSTINPFLFALCIFKNSGLIPPSVFWPFNLQHLFSQALFGVSPGSCPPPNSPSVPIYLKATTAGTVASSWDLTRGEKRLPVPQPVPLLMQPRLAFAPPETGSPSHTSHFCRAAAHRCVPILHSHSWPLACLSGLTTTCPCWTPPYLLQTIPTLWEEFFEFEPHRLTRLQPFPPRCGLQT